MLATSVFPQWLGVSGVFSSYHKAFWGDLEGTNLLCEHRFGAEQEPSLIPREAELTDSAWQCKGVGKRDSSNRNLNWDFPVYKWKSGIAASGSQEKPQPSVSLCGQSQINCIMIHEELWKLCYYWEKCIDNFPEGLCLVSGLILVSQRDYFTTQNSPHP